MKGKRLTVHAFLLTNGVECDRLERVILSGIAGIVPQVFPPLYPGEVSRERLTTEDTKKEVNSPQSTVDSEKPSAEEKS